MLAARFPRVPCIMEQRCAVRLAAAGDRGSDGGVGRVVSGVTHTLLPNQELDMIPRRGGTLRRP